ncbi:uncharacterized protein F5147DRAFT_763865 [Suillus discolor]|uniref:Uncharacterized protein n=1 Tax=Suillus discolor TaxID=1912936 RepID=A0A9P7JNT3_9AGAM|nr:uncharacterized protein F5147DRAFT_763865 [Suillus discolor]KAG2094671.1 hypothetical protein F5147DRAFT_763865 [Suillus discolor]
MSTPVQSLLANLKASTAQLVGIIAGARHIPAGSVDVQLALTKQVTTLLADIIRAHEKGEYIPGIVVSCSKELMRVCSMTPRALPNWHSIGHDDPRVARHAWRKQVHAWEVLGDNSCDLPVVPNPSTGPLTVNLLSPPVPSPTPVPSPAPVIPSPPIVTGPSSKTGTEFRDKGKGKAVSVDLEPEVGGSNKRKSPMISGHSSQPPKSAMKGHKRVKSTRLPKSKPFVESEDDEDPIVQPISGRVPEVVLPQLSTIVVRTPQLPRSPGSPKKQSFGPASLTAGRRPEVMESPVSHPEARATSGSRPEVEESSDDTSSASDGDPLANTTFDITIPGLNNPCHYCIKEDWPCATRFDKRTNLPCLSCIRCSTKKIKCNPASLGSPPKRIRGRSTTGRTRSKTSAPAPSTAPSPSLSRARTRSQSRGPSRTPAIPAATTPQVQSRGRSKTITTKKTPAPAPAPAPAPVRSSSFAVPCAALDVPMPDLHSMAIAIQDGAAHIAILEARVQEQDAKIDTLQHLHESLRRTVVDRHPSFSLPDTPADATILLDQSGPHPSILPLPSALSNLIDLDISVMQPTPLTVEDGSAMVGLMVEPTQVQPEGPQSSGEIMLPDEPGNLLPESSGNIVVPNEPGNLLPEYDSSDEELDVEGKVDLPGEEVEMAT